MRWPARGRTFGTAIATARATEHTSSPARLWRARRKGSISIVRTSTAEPSDPSGSRECGPREGVNPEPDIAGVSRNIPNTGRPPGRLPPRRFCNVQTEPLPEKDTENPIKSHGNCPEPSKADHMTKLSELKKQFLHDPINRSVDDDLGPEFDLACKLIVARAATGLSQTEVAERIKTTQSEISRIECADQNISIAELVRYAEAVGEKLDIRLDSNGAVLQKRSG